MSAVTIADKYKDIRHIDIQKVQTEDAMISSVISYVRAGKKPPKNSASCEVEAILHQNFRKLKMKDDILIRDTRNVDGTFPQQYVVPNTFSHVILHYLHNDMGHPGREKTTSLVRSRFYWPRMHSDIQKWVDECERCIKFKTLNLLYSHHEQTHPNDIFDLVSLKKLPMEEQQEKMVEASTFKKKIFCKQCGKEFISPSGLTQHMDIKHRGIRYRCLEKECKELFPRFDNMLKHHEKVHPEHKADLIALKSETSFKRKDRF